MSQNNALHLLLCMSNKVLTSDLTDAKLSSTQGSTQISIC